MKNEEYHKDIDIISELLTCGEISSNVLKLYKQSIKIWFEIVSDEIYQAGMDEVKEDLMIIIDK